MELFKKNSTSSLSPVDVIKSLCPEYGQEALNMPIPDPVMNMYIVDQHVTKGGHRQVTYLAVGKCLAVALAIGFYISISMI